MINSFSSEKYKKIYKNKENKNIKIIIYKQTMSYRKRNPLTRKREFLTKEEMKLILEQTGLNESGLNQKIKKEVVRRMKKLTYDKKYKSCWDGRPQTDLWSQSLNKVQCFLKYGDKF